MKIKRKTFLGGIVATLCACTALTFGAVFNSSGIDKVTASAATTVRASILNLDATGAAQTYFVNSLTGAQNENVYFGTNSGSPVKWRVLSTSDTKYSSGKMLLWADYQLGKILYNSSYQTQDNAYWGTSPIRASLNGSWFSTLFSSDEQNAVVPTGDYITDNFGFNSSQSQYLFLRDGITAASTGVNGKYSTTVVPSTFGNGTGVAQYAYTTSNGGVQEKTSGDKLFLLDYYDINDVTVYGFGVSGTSYANKISPTWSKSSNWFPGQFDGAGRVANNINSQDLAFSGEVTARYWLRNAGRYETARSEAFIVDAAGCIKDEYVSNVSGLRPAFNFDPETVVYATAASVGSNGSTFAAVDTVATTSDNKPAYKLYTKSSSYVNYNNTLSGAPTISFNGSSVTVNKSGQTGQAVILLAEKTGSGTVKYQATSTFSSGKAKATLPTGIKASDYSVTALFIDSVNGNTASEIVKASFTANPLTIEKPKDIVNLIYDGNSKWIDNLTGTDKPDWLDLDIYDNTDYISLKSIEYTDCSGTAKGAVAKTAVKNAGKYKVTLTLVNDYMWEDESTNGGDKTFTITVKQAELKYHWANDSSMTGASWSKDFEKSFIDGNPATANAPWVYLDYTLLSGDSAKDTDTSGGAGGTIADNKYPYIVLKFVEKVNAYGDADISVDNVRTRITNTKGTNYPKEAQTYTVTFEDKNAATSNYKLVPDTGESASRDYTINKKKITAPAKLAALEYTGAEQSFTVAQYDSDYMEYGTLAGTTFTAASVPTDMTADTTSGLVLKATKVGKYKVAYRPIVSKDSSGNDVIRNYEWQTNTTGSNVYEVEYEIKAKTLEFDFVSSAYNGTFTIKTDTTGKVTVSYKTGKGPVDDEHGNPEAVEVEIFYYYDNDGAATAVVNPGATWNEISFADLKDNTGVHTTGDYTIGVRLKSGVAANANYTIDTTAAATYTKGITINAGEASLDDMKLTYKDSTMGSNDPLQPLTAGDLKYAFDANGNPVAYFPQLDFDNTIFELVGTPTYTLADGSTPSFAGGLTQAGKVTVTVNIKIKVSEQATNKMPTGAYTGTKFKTYSRTDDYNAVVTFEYTIGKMEIDTSVFKLQYSYDQTNWKNFATADNKVEFASATIYVRIDPTSLAPVSAGISVMFGTKQYAEGKNKGAYTASADFTLTDNDNFTISSDTYNWEITNKQINVTNWVPGDFNIGGVDYIGEIMVINGHKDLYDKGVIEYVYTWSAMDGTNGTGTGETELANIFAVASPTNQVTVTATVQLKAGMSSTYDLLGTVLTSQPFYVGAAKETATITNAGSAEYGSVNESAFGVNVEADGANLPATNPLTQALLYEVYLHDYDGLSVDNVSGDGYGLLSSVDYSKLNAGKYVIEVRFTAAGAQDYAPKGARQLFEITPKKIIVPQVTKDIVYNGTYINLADYLDSNYNADIMSMLSGYTNKTAGAYAVTFKLNNTNYMWVEPTAEEPLSNKLFAKAVLFADGITIDNSALTATLNWTINKIVLSTDGWNLNSKEGVSLNALAAYQEMITANELDVAIGYRYYDTNGNLIEEPVLKGGDKYIVEAYLTGEDAINFEFVDGTDAIKSVSAQKEYTVPQSGFAKLMGSTVDFLKANWLWLVIAAVALLFLILLICLIVGAKKKKRKKEELEEQRRLEKEEREKQEREERRREEREERRMDRMSQQQMPQMMMPQMMPQMMQQQMPQMGGQSASNGGGNGGGDSAQLAQMQAELAAVKAEQAAMRAEQNAVLRSDMNALRNDYMYDRSGGRGPVPAGMSTETLVEIITVAVKNALADGKPAAQAANATPESSAAPAAAQVPPDAVMTTVTTTKIDTTKKAAQPAQAAQTSDRATPAGRTIVRNFVAPMPVDDGRVFDVGGFYTPVDPVTDLGMGDETDKTE